ncbi:MAG: DEDD exonuclease domain-containing protein [Acidimicrobiia bacterium]
MAIGLQRTFEDMGAPLSEVPFCVLDLETTGAAPSSCEITEIGAVRFEGGVPTGRFETLVNPGAAIPPFITVMTGITQAMVIEAPRIEEALPTFLEFIGDAVIVGHNVRFDMSFLNAAAERLGYGRLPNRTADTYALARRLIRSEIRNLKLSSLAAHFRSPVTPNTRALADAEATAHVFWGLLERAGTLGVTHLEDLMMLPTARGAPNYAKIALTETLPRKPGVYLFKDRGDNVFYVGKAKNLRNRVRSYFYGDTRRTITNMLQELDSIEHRVCHTELEASVTELRLIQAHIPRYNRRSKPAKSPTWIKVTDEAYPRLSMVRSVKESGLAYLGPFRSRKAAEVVVTAIWDAVPIRRCTAKPGSKAAPCSFSQLGVSVCPCGDDVAPDDYRKVVDQLLDGIENRPRLLLEPLVDKMAEHARAGRFEEAGWMRDRYRALARSLRRNRSWRALAGAGVVRAESHDGDGALIDHGRLAVAWNDKTPPLLAALDNADIESPPIPPSVAEAEEADLVWKWLCGGDVELIETTSPLSMPVTAIPVLGTIEL